LSDDGTGIPARRPRVRWPLGCPVWQTGGDASGRGAIRDAQRRPDDRARVAWVSGWIGGLVKAAGRDERDLVRRCREGSEAAYAELVRQHSSRLYALAFRLLGDRGAAEDVVQETFLAAFRAIERVEPRPSLDPWLNTIVLRVAGRAAERIRTRPNTSLDQLTDREGGWDASPDLIQQLDRSADPHAAAEAAELRREVDAAIRRLPFKYRGAVVLRYVLGLDYADAAASMGVPLNTFKSLLLRGTRLLREQLSTALTVAAPDATNGRHARAAEQRLPAEHAAPERTARG
jgi:RNA polymerase sigma factor (sigma-70 family)